MEKSMIKKPNFAKKLIAVGAGGVGKTSLLRRFTDKSLKKDYKMTIGTDYNAKTANLLGDDMVTTPILDIGGQSRFGSTRDSIIYEYNKEAQSKFARQARYSFYDGVNCLILVYDTTRRETLSKLFDTWLPEIFERLAEKCSPMPVTAVFANKIDDPGANCMYEDWKKALDEFQKKIGKDLNIDFYYTSALTHKQVESGFTIELGKSCYTGDQNKIKELISKFTPPKYAEVMPQKLSEMVGLLSEKPIFDCKKGEPKSEPETPFNQVITPEVADNIKEYGSTGFGFSDKDKSLSKLQVCEKIMSMDKSEIPNYFFEETYNNLITRIGWLIEGQYFIHQ